jgi:hypothetical protein
MGAEEDADDTAPDGNAERVESYARLSERDPCSS